MKCERCFHKPICKHYIDIRNDTYVRIGYKFSPDECKDYVGTSDITTIVHGSWIYDSGLFRCSVCEELSVVDFRTPYCSQCGAKMGGKDGENNV